MSSKLSELGKLIFSGSYCPATSFYKRLTIWVGLPVVVALSAYNIKVELDHARSGHHEKKADYPCYEIRTKPFPFVVRVDVNAVTKQCCRWAYGDKCSMLDFECKRRAREEENA